MINPKEDFEGSFLALYEVLRKRLTGNAAKWKLFTMLVLGILIHSTVNLAQIALIVPGEVKQASFYRRLQRFFEKFSFPRVQFARLLSELLPGEVNSLVLVIDRTNWKFGRSHINLLQIGAVFDGVLYPLIWRTLPQSTKRGNSASEHRIKLMSELLQMLPAERIRCLALDREFIGEGWLRWLDKQGVAFVVRLKKSALLDGESVLKLSEGRKWAGETQKTYSSPGCPVFFAAKSLPDKEDKWLMLIGNRHCGEDLLMLYKLRWGIECFFSHLKSRGFNFEQTHMTEAEKIDKLLAALALAFVFSHRRGLEEENKKKAIEKTWVQGPEHF